jgi:hypothetical protein
MYSNVSILINSNSSAAQTGVLVYVNAVHHILATTEEVRLSDVRVIRPDGATAAIPLRVVLSYDQASRVVFKNILVSSYETVHVIDSGANQLRSFEFEGVTFRDCNVTLRGAQVLISNSSFIRTLANISNDDYTTSNEFRMYLSDYVGVFGCTLQHSSLFILSNVTEAHRNTYLSSFALSDGTHLPPIAPRYIDSDKEVKRLGYPAPGRIDARQNYWGASSGPSTCCNPAGAGLPVIWVTDFSEWCTVHDRLTWCGPNSKVSLLFSSVGPYLHVFCVCILPIEFDHASAVSREYPFLFYGQSMHTSR